MAELEWTTKDSGARAQYDSGMQRDTEEGKARFDLLVPNDVPYEEQMLTRFADLLARGAEKYTERNWEKANSEAELKRYYSSAYRHFMQWITGETDEDHAAAVFFNIMCAETLKYKLKQPKTDVPEKQNIPGVMSPSVFAGISKGAIQPSVVKNTPCKYMGRHASHLNHQQGAMCECGWTL